MRTVCIAGSPRSASTTRKVLDSCRGLLEEAGFQAIVLDLHELSLPAMTPDLYGARAKLPESVNEFANQVLAADAVVLGTPVYHATFSGLLKGALDHLSADALDRKPVGLVANVGGTRGGTSACDHLRAVVKALGGWAVPTQVVTHRTDLEGDLVSPLIQDRLGQMVSELAWFSGLAKSA